MLRRVFVRGVPTSAARRAAALPRVSAPGTAAAAAAFRRSMASAAFSSSSSGGGGGAGAGEEGSSESQRARSFLGAWGVRSAAVWYDALAYAVLGVAAFFALSSSGRTDEARDDGEIAAAGRQHLRGHESARRSVSLSGVEVADFNVVRPGAKPVPGHNVTLRAGLLVDGRAEESVKHYSHTVGAGVHNPLVALVASQTDVTAGLEATARLRWPNGEEATVAVTVHERATGL